MTATAVQAKSLKNQGSWRDFIPGRWQNAIDVRDFIVCNATPYDGDEKFLAAPTNRTKAVWAKLQPYFQKEREEGRTRRRCQDALDNVGAQGRLHRSR